MIKEALFNSDPRGTPLPSHCFPTIERHKKLDHKANAADRDINGEEVEQEVIEEHPIIMCNMCHGELINFF